MIKKTIHVTLYLEIVILISKSYGPILKLLVVPRLLALILMVLRYGSASMTRQAIYRVKGLIELCCCQHVKTQRTQQNLSQIGCIQNSISVMECYIIQKFTLHLIFFRLKLFDVPIGYVPCFVG